MPAALTRMARSGVSARSVLRLVIAVWGGIVSALLLIALTKNGLQQDLDVRTGGDVIGGPAARLTSARYRSCNRQLADRYHALITREIHAEAQLFRRRAWRLLSVAVSACERLGIPHWLGSGTLLGFIRQCELVPAMGDVDLELASESFTREGGVPVQQLEEAFTSTGLRQTTKFGTLNDSLEMSFEDEFGTRIDVFLSYPSAENRYTAGVDTDTLKRIRWVYPKIDLCWSLLEGLVIGVPCDPTRYLEVSYGPNWTLPLKKEWNYRTDGTNTVDNGYWSEDVRREVIHLYKEA